MAPWNHPQDHPLRSCRLTVREEGTGSLNAETTKEPQRLPDILDRLAESADGSQVSLEQLLDAFGRRSFGPMLLVPALIALLPTGAIPGMSIVTGSLIILVGVQMLLPVDQPWFPSALRRIRLGRERFDKSIESARPWTRRLNRLVGPRLEFMAEPPVNYVTALVCIAMGVMMFPLALLPFAVAIPAGTVVLLALGVTTRDGLVISLGLASALLGSYFALRMLP